MKIHVRICDEVRAAGGVRVTGPNASEKGKNPMERTQDSMRPVIRMHEAVRDDERNSDLEDVEDFYQNVLDGEWAIVDHFISGEIRHVVAIEVKHDGNQVRGLSKRELQILELLKQGDSNKAMGFRLGISTGAVAAHLHRIYRKIGVSERGSAVRMSQLLLPDHSYVESPDV